MLRRIACPKANLRSSLAMIRHPMGAGSKALEPSLPDSLLTEFTRQMPSDSKDFLSNTMKQEPGFYLRVQLF